jgi:hypothetical protein
MSNHRTFFCSNVLDFLLNNGYHSKQSETYSKHCGAFFQFILTCFILGILSSMVHQDLSENLGVRVILAISAQVHAFLFCHGMIYDTNFKSFHSCICCIVF